MFGFAEVVFALCAVLLMGVFQFRVLWMWIPLEVSGCVGCLKFVVSACGEMP